MVKSLIPKSLYPLILGCCILLTSCGNPSSLTPTPAAIRATSIKMVTTQPKSTPTSMPTTLVSKTPSPTMVSTITTSPTPVSSLTPLATLDTEEAERKIMRLMETNRPCSGFCFWGITPGVTHFAEAIRFLKTISDKALVETNDQYRAGYQYKGKSITVNLRIFGSNSLVENLSATINGIGLPNVTGKDWLAFRPDSFLKSYGPPNHIKIIMYEGPEGMVSYEMILLYDQMYIRYSGNQITIKPQSILRACPIQDHNIGRFDLWLGEYDAKVISDGVELSRISPVTEDQFYQILVGAPENACFDLDYNKFLSPN